MPYTPSSDRATTRKPETAPPRIATWTASTRLRRAAAAVRTFERTLMYMPMIPDAIEERDPRAPAEVEPEDVGVGDFLALERGDHRADDDGAHDGEHADRRVLALDERVRALADHVSDILHRLRALVAGQHVAGEIQGEQDGGDPGNRDDELERARIHG